MSPLDSPAQRAESSQKALAVTWAIVHGDRSEGAALIGESDLVALVTSLIGLLDRSITLLADMESIPIKDAYQYLLLGFAQRAAEVTGDLT